MEAIQKRKNIQGNYLKNIFPLYLKSNGQSGRTYRNQATCTACLKFNASALQWEKKKYNKKFILKIFSTIFFHEQSFHFQKNYILLKIFSFSQYPSV